MWVLMNHYRDEEDDWKKQELICRIINPSVASAYFDKKDVEVTVSTEDLLFKQMSQDLKGKYTAAELQAIMDDPKHYSELDRIEKA